MMVAMELPTLEPDPVTETAMRASPALDRTLISTSHAIPGTVDSNRAWLHAGFPFHNGHTRAAQFLELVLRDESQCPQRHII